MISQRSGLVDASGIRKVFELAHNLKNPINLSIGQPDFDIPDAIKDEAKKAIDEGFNRYTVTQGIPELRAKVRAQLASRNLLYEDLLITSGVSGGILLTLLATTDPGDEILIPDPYFVMYKHLANLLGVTPRYIDTYPDFLVDAARIEEAITDRTKLVFLNSPANPTGKALPDEELRDIATLLRKKNIICVYDEIYDHFCYDYPHGNIAEYYENTIILNGFSKAYAMTGWRLGYAAGPKEIIDQMIKLQQYTFVCAPSMVQKAGVAALDYDISDIVNQYKEKRDLVYQGLKDTFQVTKPEGAFYIFPEAPRADADRFVKAAIEHNVLIIPGEVFSQRNTHFRISYATRNDTLQKGVDILCDLAKKMV